MNKKIKNKESASALTEVEFLKFFEEMKKKGVFKTKGEMPVHSVLGKQKGDVQSRNKKVRDKENALVRKGIEFQKLIERMKNQGLFETIGDASALLDVLNELKMKSGYRLIHIIEGYDLDKRAVLRAAFDEVSGLDADGNEILSKGYINDDFMKYIDVPSTEMGIWQAFILHNAEREMYLRWHYNYTRRTYLYGDYSKKRIKRYVVGKVFEELDYASRLDSLDLDPLLPSVEMNDQTAIVKCAYWASFGGGLKFTQTLVENHEGELLFDEETNKDKTIVVMPYFACCRL